MLFYPSNLMWHKPLSLQLEDKTAFNKCFETGRYYDGVHNWLKCKTYMIPNDFEL